MGKKKHSNKSQEKPIAMSLFSGCFSPRAWSVFERPHVRVRVTACQTADLCLVSLSLLPLPIPSSLLHVLCSWSLASIFADSLRACCPYPTQTNASNPDPPILSCSFNGSCHILALLDFRGSLFTPPGPGCRKLKMLKSLFFF